MSATALTQPAPSTPAEFTAFDRCDGNQSEQARVEFRTAQGGTLLFCSHHANKHEAKILSDGGSITRDQRAVAQPS